jgi:hypothetical protein
MRLEAIIIENFRGYMHRQTIAINNTPRLWVGMTSANRQ